MKFYSLRIKLLLVSLLFIFLSKIALGESLAAIKWQVDSPNSVCVGNQESIRVGLNAQSLTAVVLAFEYKDDLMRIKNVELAGNGGRWSIKDKQLRISSFYMSENLPDSFQMTVVVEGLRPGISELELFEEKSSLMTLEGNLSLAPLSEEIKVVDCEKVNKLIKFWNWIVRIF